MQLITFEQIQLFMSLFKGRNDIYARRWEKDGKNGYSPAYEVNWTEYSAFKAKGGKFADFPNKKPLLLTTEVIQAHLNGVQTVGIYPLLTDNTSHFIAADFDKENWQEESKGFVEVCKEYGIPAYLERSQSGKGAHVWVFFEEKYPANKSRAIIFELIREALKLSEFEKEVSFDRLFPNQDYHTNQGIGNLIALPLQGTSVTTENTLFINPQTMETISEQWKYLKSVRKISTLELNELYKTLIEGDSQFSSTPMHNGTSGKLTIIMGSTIKLPKASLQPQLVKFLREKLNFFNTEYLVKEKMGISTYQTEKYFKLISEAGEYVLLPRGFLSELIKFCNEQNLQYKIIDERKLQTEITFTFRELIIQFNPYYLYGLTATTKRKYNDERLIYYYIGEILTTIDQNKQLTKSRQKTNEKHTTVEIHGTELTVPFDRKIDTFEVLSKILIFDSNRNTIIIQDILRHLMKGKKILVLTERKEHVEVLSLYLKTHCEVITLTGDDSVSKRKLKLEQLNMGHFQVLIATGQLLGEGLDLPILDCLFLVYPFSFEGKLIQYIGRIQRSENQKVIVDYTDLNIPFFAKMSKKRNAYYRKNEWI